MKHISEQFTIEQHIDPGEHLTVLAQAANVQPERLMRDYAAVAQDANLTVVVGDMANNLTGTTYADQALAGELGLPADYAFNGGLIGSLVLRKGLAGSQETGQALVMQANALLADAYQRYGIGDGHHVDAAERFTGYLAHILIGPDETTLTAVGDVNAWINGQHVIGEEKAVDAEKEILVDALTACLEQPPTAREAQLALIARTFAAKAHLDESLTTSLCRELIEAVQHTEAPDRQTVYRPVDTIVTPWQIRTLQNHTPDSHPWAYGAIDGTKTPESYIRTYTVPTKTIDSIVIATDGSVPQVPGAPVTRAADLRPINPKYSEQTVLTLTQTGVSSSTGGN